MKKFGFCLILMALALTACHKDILNDIDGLKGDVADLQTRVEALEAQCKQLNSDIATLQTLITALQQNDMIASIAGSETDGYTITFVSGKVVTLKSGATGADGYSPVVGAKQDSDSIYYWTIDGEFVKDSVGNALSVTGADGATGITPLLQIDETGYWKISYDNGTTWTTLGQATGDAGKSFFKKIEFTESDATITLIDGTKLILPRTTDGENDYTLTYDANGGKGTMDTETIWSQLVTTAKECAFTRTGYWFLAWNTQPDGTGIAYEAGSPIILKENTTLYAQWIDPRFTVSATRRVVFSPGNLQYQAYPDKTWRFAEHQYDYIGSANQYIDFYNEGWIDLFGWGTGDDPTKTSGDANDYSTFTDWGTNAIGDYAANTWQTPTTDEWVYVFQTRANASNLYGLATVNDIKGLILLPDSFSISDGITFKSGHASYTNNAYTTTQWEQMEAHGAIFLPAAGSRNDTDVYNVQERGFYWSSTENGETDILILIVGETIYFNPHTPFDRSYGRSVRLIREL